MPERSIRRCLATARQYVPFIGGSLIVLAVFIWVENNFAKSFQACIAENASAQRADTSKQHGEIVARGVEGQFVCSIRMVDRHNGLVSALAAISVAFFTYTLWRSNEKLWKSGRDALEATERAFVFIEGFDIELTTAANARIELGTLPERYRAVPELCITRFAAIPRWKNSGNTPTRKMIIRVHWRGPGGPIPPEYVYPNAETAFFVAPQAIERSEAIDMSGAPRALVDYHYFSPGGDEPLIFIWGRADYEDIFQQSHFLEWCYRLRLDRHDGVNFRANFVQWGDYNRTDKG
jgi:hypothetical protein